MICASHPALLKHSPPRGHPEQPARLRCIYEALERRFGAGTVVSLYRLATKAELYAAHSPEYIDYLFSLGRSETALDDETFFSKDSLECVLLSAGIGLELVERIAAGTYRKCFALVRPPGHHAGSSCARGYCIINTMAVAVQRALSLGFSRIALIDWDVHHGNGTQEIFFNTASVYGIDLHQDRLFPQETGTPSEIGSGPGKGFTLNLPLPPESTGAYYCELMESTVYPLLKSYKPHLLCISCGFDALCGDSESTMCLQPQDYGALTGIVCSWADELCGGRLFMVLEGGYNSALAEAATAVWERIILS
ncbi:MAG: histone deacetylase [Spirochaetaceae bacterium]|jgi:acetoin utilization deacetylase AcuC-like enzyme|nr:histone deacetylase [Spirochaetaceae bacterium]